VRKEVDRLTDSQGSREAYRCAARSVCPGDGCPGGGGDGSIIGRGAGGRAQQARSALRAAAACVRACGFSPAGMNCRFPLLRS
jgi:hypothetical protein